MLVSVHQAQCDCGHRASALTKLALGVFMLDHVLGEHWEEMSPTERRALDCARMLMVQRMNGEERRSIGRAL